MLMEVFDAGKMVRVQGRLTIAAALLLLLLAAVPGGAAEPSSGLPTSILPRQKRWHTPSGPRRPCIS